MVTRQATDVAAQRRLRFRIVTVKSGVASGYERMRIWCATVGAWFAIGWVA